MERTYLIRTFGCQMNEHDSERIAGVLEANGMRPTEDIGDARVVVFNTCAIRENADNRLYGNLGHLKPLKDRDPSLRVLCFSSPRLCPEAPAGVRLLEKAKSSYMSAIDTYTIPE